MPIIIKDFKWKQTHDQIIIQVPLRGVHPSKTDIFTSPQYIKASFGSFFFETVLLHPVEIESSSCTKSSSEIFFNLKKCNAEIWDSLEIDVTRQERMKLKKRFINEERERLKKKSEEKVGKNAELKRVAVNEQIELDSRVRKSIEEIKKSEETKALGDLNDWKKELELPNGHIQQLDTMSDLIEKLPKEKNTVVKSRPKSIKIPKEKCPAIPKLRSTRALQVLFTAREFPTPCRESRVEEENDFLRKQAEARRSAGFVDEDLRPEEKNPQYLLAKGREFLKTKNYLGAISALSFGIKLSPKFLDLYLTRSEAHLAIGNFNRTVEDCTSALELLKPALPINLDDRALCIGRRGIGLFKLGFAKQGIGELEASLKLKSNLEFENRLEQFRREFEELKTKELSKNSTKCGKISPEF